MKRIEFVVERANVDGPVSDGRRGVDGISRGWRNPEWCAGRGGATDGVEGVERAIIGADVDDAVGNGGR